MRFFVLLITIVSVSLNVSFAFDRYTAHGGPIKGLAYSSKLDLLVSTSFDYTAVVWDSTSMRELKQLIGHNAAVNTAAFSPDGQWMATAGDDNQVLLWSVNEIRDAMASPTPIALTGHTAKVIHLTFNADGSRLASSSWDGTVGLWDVPNRQSIRFLKGHQGPSIYKCKIRELVCQTYEASIQNTP